MSRGIGHGVLGIGHWALVLSEAVGAASRREVLGMGHWALGIAYSPSSPSSSSSPSSPPLPTPHSPVSQS